MENIDLTDNFMRIAKVIAEESQGKIFLEQYKGPYNHHYLRLQSGEKIGKNIEEYGLLSRTDSLGHGLPYFYFLIHDIKIDCPLSYEKAISLIQEVGNKVFEGDVLINWNRMFTRNP